MANRGGKNTGGRYGVGADRSRGAHKPRVMCVEPDAMARERRRKLLHGLSVPLVVVESVEAARKSLAANACDVLMLDVAVRGAFDLARERAAGADHGSTIFLAAKPTVALTVRAMRCGALDVLRKPLDADELLARLDAAVQRSERLRREDRRIERLERMCKRLAADVTEESAPAPTKTRQTKQPEAAYTEDSSPIPAATPGAEYARMVRGELDVENLLRVTLEWMLAKTGPTNSAVYLPTGHDDYSLGAYVNYDLPKDASDFLLDHLADVVPARFERKDAVHHITAAKDMERHLGEAANWFADPNLIVFPCVSRGECLAVVALFRSARAPFPEAILDQLRSMRPVFAEQLARVIRVHNRHKDEEWLGFDVDTGDPNAGPDTLNHDPDGSDDRTDNLAA